MQDKTPRKKVLVVDDESDERIFLSRLLELGGYEPVLAADAREGLEKAEHVRPDSIVLAVMFDQKGNLILLDDLKLNKSLKHIPVILLSSIDQQTLFQLRSLPGGSKGGTPMQPDGFLNKPPEAEDLLGILKDLTG